MKKWAIATLMAFQFGVAGQGWAQDMPDPTVTLDPNRDTSRYATGGDSTAPGGTSAPLSVSVEGIPNGQRIPDTYAYCVPDGKGQTRPGDNISPAVHWFGAPAGTKSYALIVVDEDVPANLGAINQGGKPIAATAPRQEFYHWVLADIPASLITIPAGADSKGIVAGGKPVGKTSFGLDGQNDYAAKAHQGKGGGYDGPCPPWNDARLHHYHFVVYALDAPTLSLAGNFTGDQARKAMSGHVLAQGETVGTYSTNPALGMR